MSAGGVPLSYRFATAAQWGSGLLQGATPVAQGGLEPATPHSDAQRLWAGGSARALTVAADGTLLWLDEFGRLRWLDAAAAAGTAQAGEPCALAPGADAIGRATRLVAGRRRLWAARADSGVIAGHALPTLQPVRDIVVEGRVLDIAAAGVDGVLALVERHSSERVLERYDANGRARGVVEPAAEARARPAQVAGASNAVALLDADGAHLRWFAPQAGGSAGPALRLEDLVPGFQASSLGADRTGRFLLACAASHGGARGERLLVLGANGALLEDLLLPDGTIGAVLGVGGDRGAIWLAAASGVWRLGGGEPAAARAASAVFLTPALNSPVGQELGWLRADLLADLPPGATVACRVASDDDEDRVAGLRALQSDPKLPPAARFARLRGALGWGGRVVLGAGRDAPSDTVEEEDEPRPPTRLALPLHAVGKPWLWIEVEFTGSPRQAAPRLRELSVHYPDRSLVQNLPAIYRAGDRPLGHLRRLVALLETGTQALDARIAALGQLADPATAPPDWLDFLGGWLGLPWEAALPEPVKRAMLSSAGALLGARGTRAGLMRLARCVLPRRPVRVLDPAVELAPALIGAARLPAVLLGAAGDEPYLGGNAVIGHACLPRGGAGEPRDPLGPLSGWIRVEVSATEQERAALGEMLERLLASFVPAGVRVVLRWRPWPSSGLGRRIGEDIRLLAAAPAVLGRGGRLGSVTVAAEDPSRLPVEGIATGFRLT